jgi:hypothetical protein
MSVCFDTYPFWFQSSGIIREPLFGYSTDPHFFFLQALVEVTVFQSRNKSLLEEGVSQAIFGSPASKDVREGFGVDPKETHERSGSWQSPH